LDRLAGSRGPWSLYEILPYDTHKVMRDIDDDYLAQVLPEEVVDEYIYDGEPMTREKAEELGLEGKVVDENGEEVADGQEGTYVRDLRDYEILFKAFDLDETEWGDEYASAERDREYAEAAANDAKQQVGFRQSEIAELKQESAKFHRELDAVVAHQKAVERKLAEVERSAAELAANNRSIASQIAQVQLDAQRRIDERTRRMARDQ
jgi:hypothetical protein